MIEGVKKYGLRKVREETVNCHHPGRMEGWR